MQVSCTLLPKALEVAPMSINSRGKGVDTLHPAWRSSLLPLGTLFSLPLRHARYVSFKIGLELAFP